MTVPGASRRELRRTAEALADSLRTLAAAPWPVHLHSVARQLGVTSIERAPMLEDGKTWWDGDLVRIRLRADRSRARQRFTLAHELAHVALSHRADAPFHRAPWDHSQEERLCDLVAAALLMPAELIAERFPPGPVGLRQLREFAAAGDVSLAACVLRVNTLTRRHLCLIRADAVQREWRVISATGLNRPTAERLRVTTPPSVLERRVAEGGGTAAVDLVVGGRDVTRVGAAQCRFGRLLILLPGLAPDDLTGDGAFP